MQKLQTVEIECDCHYALKQRAAKHYDENSYDDKKIHDNSYDS